jgi:hypothetical protein
MDEINWKEVYSFVKGLSFLASGLLIINFFVYLAYDDVKFLYASAFLLLAVICNNEITIRYIKRKL